VSMGNVPNLRIQGTYLPNTYLHCFCASLGVFSIYPLLFCSLQHIYEDMYCSYLSVASGTSRDNWKSYVFILIMQMISE